jgi:hypothetical protein
MIIPQVHAISWKGVIQYLSELDAFHRAATQHVFKQDLELFDLILWELELLRLGFGEVTVEANIKEVGIVTQEELGKVVMLLIWAHIDIHLWTGDHPV